MPKASSPTGVASEKDPNTTTPRISLREQGYSGLKVTNGQIIEESQKAFQYPHIVKVVEEFRAIPTVAAGMHVYRSSIARKKWRVVAPPDADDKLKERTKIIGTMLLDMEDSWSCFINSIIPFKEFGFSIHNIVLKRRLHSNGSLYNDGLVGIKRLPVRNQGTIKKWYFDEGNRDLLSVGQSVSTIQDNHKLLPLLNNDNLIEIPRQNFLLFTSNGTSGNPQGVSLYKSIYLAAKQLMLLQDHLMLIAAREGKGRLKIEVPAAYLDPESSLDGGAAKAAFETLAKNIDSGTAGTLILPQEIDQESGLKLFDYGYMENKGTSTIDIEKAIEALKNDILQGLAVDVLKLGANGGSNALAESKTSMLSLMLDTIMKEIADPLNKQLIPLLFRMNGWSTESLPHFEYYDDEDVSILDVSAAMQRLLAVGGIERTRPLLNYNAGIFGLPQEPADKPVDPDLLSLDGMKSKSGSGMAEGVNGDGTAKDPSKQDKSVANKANAP